MENGYFLTNEEYFEGEPSYLELRECGIYKVQIHNKNATVHVSKRTGQVYELNPFVLADIERAIHPSSLRDDSKISQTIRLKSLDEKLKACAERIALSLGIDLSK